MRKALSVIALSILFLASCVYTGRGDISVIRRLGKPGDFVITVDVAALRSSDAASLIPDWMGEVAERTDRISVSLAPEGDGYPLPLGSWSITGLAHGRLSSTEVGTFLIWDPGFVRKQDSDPRYYTSRSYSLDAGVPRDGIVLFTSSSTYRAAYNDIFVTGDDFIPEDCLRAMEGALAALYVEEPETLFPVGFDVPAELVRKVGRVLLLISDAHGAFRLDGEIIMDSEDSARTLCTLLRNMLVQSIRRSGERLDVRAISGIFTYEGKTLRISGCTLGYDAVGSLLTKENMNAAL